ncbi:MAG: hypothetical protein IJC12_04250 [Peptococcaceae bacterium]|nr:hypothetical protein [Peptococcaceae bacterium]
MGIFWLILGILMDAVGTVFLKNSLGFTVLMPAVLCLLCYIVCNVFISKSLSTIKLGIAYATWYGGAVLFAALLSIFVYHESLSPLAMVGLLILLVGIVISNLGDTGEETK